MSNIAPIRTSSEINTIITNAQWALASLGSQVAIEEMNGVDNTNVLHQDKIYQVILLDAYLFTILDSKGNILSFFQSSTNALIFNNILTGLQNLSSGYGGPNIPLLIARNSSISYFSGALPRGGTALQFLRKKSNADYDTEFVTLVVSLITDLVATANELNFSQGVNAPIQPQINTLNSGLATESTNRSNADSALQGQISAETAARIAAINNIVTNYLALTGGTLSGALAMGNNKITGLAAATTNGDAVRYEQITDGPFLTASIGYFSNWISNSGFSYRYSRNGTHIQLKGSIKKSSSAPTSGESAVQIPISPSGITRFIPIVGTNASGPGTQDKCYYIQIDNTGTISVYANGNSGAFVGTSPWIFYFDGIEIPV